MRQREEKWSKNRGGLKSHNRTPAGKQKEELRQ